MKDSAATSPKGADTSGAHLWLVLMKAHRSLGRHAARSLERFDLGLSEFATLELLLHKGPHKVNDIGRRIDLTSGSITTAVDRLEARGLVVRGFDDGDRRTRIVRLTAKGRSHITRVFESHAAVLESAVAGLSKPERTSLIGLLKKLGISAETLLA